MSSKNVLIVLFFLLLMLPLVIATTTATKQVNIALYHLTPKQELCRCEAFNYNFIVYNTGSFNETYTFSVSKYTKSFNISPSAITLKPNETAKIGIGARLPCSITQPNIDFIARTQATRLKVKTPLQLSINSSCFAPDVNITKLQIVPKEAKALSALFIVLLLLVMILSLISILQKRPKEYWWSSYFKIGPEIRIEPERKTTIIEIVTIVIVVIFLVLIGLRGFQKIGRNETLITTFMGPKNVTQPITNISIKPAFERLGEKIEGCVQTICKLKQSLWPYKAYISISLVLLILIIIMSIIIIRRKKAKPKKVKEVRKIQKIRWRYIIIPIIIIILLASIAVSAFFVYKNRSKLGLFLSETITKLKLGKVKDILLPKFRTALDFAKDAFDFVRPYLIYVVIGVVLLVIIILILRRREKRVAKVVSVKEKRPRKERKRIAKKKK